MAKKFPKVGYEVKGRVLSVKGFCSAGHKEGDEFDLLHARWTLRWVLP
jgi:uncharacterized repeat protein (TIGR04076 family)